MFPGPTLRAAASRVLESALNQSLALDPAGRRDFLNALSGLVQFRITGPGTLFLTLQKAGAGVQVGSEPAEDPSLELCGPPLAFIALALGDRSALSQGRIAVNGDAALAHEFQRALEQLDPDWEAALARHAGDLPAHFIGQRVRAAVSWSRQASASLNANLEEYIHEESRQLPGRRELEATFADIDSLSLRSERLAARVERLQRQAGESSPESTPSSPESQ
ncbi:SCP2 domain-containing protein [Marinobacter sp.]|uniref:ubiquinone biosynthesis accessory factor UbiJ n=1 Tax=Marinobacter sp. TaxID=50741 RepID=UPI00385098D8